MSGIDVERGLDSEVASRSASRPVTTVALARATVDSVRRASRWWAARVGAWTIGAIGAVAPTALFGEPPAGLAAAFALGLVSVAVVAPLLVTPLVATVVCDDDQHQVAPAWHVLGLTAGRRLVGRGLAAARVSLHLLVVGAVAGGLAGAGLALHGAGPVRVGLAGGPTPSFALAGIALLALSWVLGTLLGAWAVTSVRALLALSASLLATGAVASLLYFAPGLRPLFWCMPWAALWPFDPQSFDSAQFASSVPLGIRVLSGGAWVLVLAVSTARRRRRAPYPVPGESRRGQT